ncbi:hypothetical protein TNIN_264021 [Trichonephila inaurata madagascariensis]|uniref:Uncharacterized protein n=1 Tax=Trichonephila inaurata madagascariensis TaxID=2747483 RepID=A0A8X6MBL0_9ARAC|nr:hypothetical protein TNIN_264021 [Trichonephila inaurata madagascariensis]
MDRKFFASFLLLFTVAVVTTAPAIDKRLGKQDNTLKSLDLSTLDSSLVTAKAWFSTDENFQITMEKVKGSYGYTDPNGLYRQVEYTAGEEWL